MKKALGILALVGSAAALVAYKLKKEDQKAKSHDDTFDTLSEDDMSARILRSAEEASPYHEEASIRKPATTTTSYPALTEEDMMYLNEVSEAGFTTMEAAVADEKERPLQHAIHFDEEGDLERFKKVVINAGYVVTTGEHTNDLLVLNISEVNADVVLSKVFYLANLAKEHKGKYVNWLFK